MDWLEIPELDGIALTDSFILGWLISEDSVTFQMEFVLCHDHPEYSVPSQSEWACFKKGILMFSGVSSLIGLPVQEAVRANIDPSGEKDYDEIEYMSVSENVYKFGLNFGEVIINAKALFVSLS